MKERPVQFASFFIFIGIIFLVLFGIVSWGVYTENKWLYSIDLKLIEMTQSNVTETKTIVLSTLSEIGNIRLIVGLAIALIIFLFIKKQYVVGLWLGGTILFCAAIGTKLIKKAVNRTRPDMLQLIEKTTESFPSGHATSATIFYGMLGLVLILLTKKVWRKVVIVFMTLTSIGFILMTRVYLGVHFPTDVLAGFLYGTASIFISIGMYQLAQQPLQHALKRFGFNDESILLFRQMREKQR